MACQRLDVLVRGGCVKEVSVLGVVKTALAVAVEQQKAVRRGRQGPEDTVVREGRESWVSRASPLESSATNRLPSRRPAQNRDRLTEPLGSPVALSRTTTAPAPVEPPE